MARALRVEFVVGCIPMYAGIKKHSERGYLSAMETYHAKMAELAQIGAFRKKSDKFH